MNNNQEAVITKYNDKGELVMIAVNNLNKKTVEFYKTLAIDLETASEMLTTK